jgi:hypothetical protein
MAHCWLVAWSLIPDRVTRTTPTLGLIQTVGTLWSVLAGALNMDLQLVRG